MAAAVRAAADFPGLKVLALTVVTSLTDTDLAAVGLTATVDEQVVRLAQLAGCHGVVAAPREAAALRAALGPDMLIVTPGVRLPADLTAGATTEHARPAHPVAAVRAGATHVVIGRSLTRAADPAAVLAHLADELGGQGRPRT